MRYFGHAEHHTTRPDTRQKMRLVCVFFTFENNTGHTNGRTDGHDLLQRCDGASKNRTSLRGLNQNWMTPYF